MGQLALHFGLGHLNIPSPTVPEHDMVEPLAAPEGDVALAIGLVQRALAAAPLTKAPSSGQCAAVRAEGATG